MDVGHEHLESGRPLKQHFTSRLAEPSEHKRHAEFWFDDGDIVLDVEGLQFKIHNTALRCSDIFSDMLELPQPDIIDRVGECPSVALAGDTARDWLVALRWMYDTQVFERQPQPVPFDAISGALRISTKYEIENLRGWAIQQLLSRWPQDVERLSTLGLAQADEAIALARECDVPEILPAAFYALSVQRWSRRADGGFAHTVLAPADLRRLISGREHLQDLLLSIMVEPLPSGGTDMASMCQCRVTLERFWRRRLVPNSQSPWGCWLLRELHAMKSPTGSGLDRDVCPTCAYAHQILVDRRLGDLKHNLPRFFSL